MIEAFELRHTLIELIFARMAEWRMPKIMSECHGFCEVFIQPERSRYRSRNLRNFERMCQASSVMIAFMSDKNLRFLLQSTKS